MSFTAVSEALTPEARERITEWFTRLNPHYRGALVSDILDMLDQADAFLAVTEPYWEAAGDGLAATIEREHPQSDACEIVRASALASTILFGLTGLTEHLAPVPMEFRAFVATLADNAARGEAWVIAPPESRNA